MQVIPKVKLKNVWLLEVKAFRVTAQIFRLFTRQFFFLFTVETAKTAGFQIVYGTIFLDAKRTGFQDIHNKSFQAVYRSL